MRNRKWLCAFVCLVVLLSGCGGGSGTGTGVSGSANFLNGPTKTTARAQVPHGQRLADGHYYLTPDKVTFTVVSLVFLDAAGNQTTSSLAGCVVTYDRSAPSLSKLLACPFSVTAGTYSGIAIVVNTAYSVLVNDDTNHVYSDPTVATNLTSTKAASAGFITVNANGPAGTNMVTTYFATPLTVSAAAPPTVQIVFDATHLLRTQITGGAFVAPAFSQGPPLIASISGFGSAAFYSNLSSASTVIDPTGPSFYSASVQLFYSSTNQPVSAQFTYGPQLLCHFGCASSCAAGPGTSIATGAWNGNQKDLPGRTSYFGIAGYLGKDTGGNISWAFPTDFSFTAWAAVLSMLEKTTIGQTTTLNFACTSSDPGPATGNFSAGAPSFTPTGSTVLTLVAQ